MATTAQNQELSFGELQGLRLRSPVLMSRHTGRRISDEAHLRQSIVDILTTPLGSRVMLRNYGSRLFQLIDRPINDALLLELYSATIEALGKWEPRILVTNVQFDTSGWTDGRLVMSLEGHYLLTSQPLRIRDIAVDFMQINRFDIGDPYADEFMREATTLGDIALAQPTEIKMAFLADCGSVGATQTAVKHLLTDWGAEVLLTGGNMNDPSGDAETLAVNQAVWQSWYSAKQWFPALGPKEWSAAGGKAVPHLTKFGYLSVPRRYYSVYFHYVGVEVFVIDTDPREPDGVTSGSLQAQWLRTALNSSKARYRIVVGNMAAVSRATDAVAQGVVASHTSWIQQLPKVQLYLHSGTGTSQHNLVTSDNAPQMHLLDSEVLNLHSTVGATLEGYTTNVQSVWAGAEVGQHCPPTVTKLVFNKQYATVTVHHATTGETLHTFHLHPY